MAQRMRLYLLVVGLLKYLPVVFTICKIVDMQATWFEFHAYTVNAIASYLVGISLLTWIYLLLSSIALSMPLWHRVLLYFYFVSEAMIAYDDYVGIPLSNWHLYMVNNAWTVLCVGFALFLRWTKVGRRIESRVAERWAQRDTATSHRYLLLTLKVLPMLLVLLSIVDGSIFYIFQVPVPMGILAGVSWLMLLYLYVSSYVFEFCNYHRMFLHYIFLVLVFNTGADVFNYEVPYFDTIGILLTTAGVFMFIALYQYVRHHQKTSRTDIARH